jgi:hypothetical protein
MVVLIWAKLRPFLQQFNCWRNGVQLLENTLLNNRDLPVIFQRHVGLI